MHSSWSWTSPVVAPSWAVRGRGVLVAALLAAWAAPAAAQEAPAEDAADAVDEGADTDAVDAADEGATDDTGGVALSGEYLRELRTAEEKVRDLKERVFRSKATLQLLRELVLEGASGGAALRITHVDDLPRAYRIDGVRYFLDGKTLYTWVDPDGARDVPEELPVLDGPISAGAHTVQVSLDISGNGGGLFGYVDDYKVKVEASCSVEVDGGQLTDLRVRIVSKGGVRKRFIDRPTIECEERREQLELE